MFKLNIKHLAVLAALSLGQVAWGVDAVTVDASGNVGIGTSSPGTKLEVNGEIALIGATTSGALGQGRLRFGRTNDYRIDGGADFLGYRYYINGTERMRMDADGNVGIGTTGPGARLDIRNAGLTQYAVYAEKSFLGGGVGQSTAGFIATDAAVNATGVIIGQKGSGSIIGDDAYPFAVLANAVQVFALTGTGNVRIGGSTSPGSAWCTSLALGKDGNNKLVAGYLSSLSNKVTIGAHAANMGAWAPIQVSGTEVHLSYMETPILTLSRRSDQHTIDIGGGDPGSVSAYKVSIGGGSIRVGAGGGVYSAGSIRIGSSNSPGPDCWGQSLTIGTDSNNKCVIGYVTSNSNKVTIGSHAPNLGAWAPLQVSGTEVHLSYMETPVLTLNRRSNENTIDIAGGDPGSVAANQVAIGGGHIRVGTGGGIHCGANYWSDYVFEPTYSLKPLTEVEAFVKENKHLPGVPSEKEVKEKGIDMAGMMAKQLEKIEELTLYAIQAEKERDSARRELTATAARLATTEAKLADLAARLERLESNSKK